MHIHGLGVDPADNGLLVATHTGLWRVEDGSTTPERVGSSRQDTMGFTVVAPGRYFGSGHPDVRQMQEEGLPPHLGLIESNDGGETWDSVSLLGEADFHVLRAAGQRVYGVDASSGRLLASTDEGLTWAGLPVPGPIVDLAVEQPDGARLLATSVGGLESGLFETGDGGKSWQRTSENVGLLAWPAPDRLYLVTAEGDVLVSGDRGRTFAKQGSIEGEPAALASSSNGDLYAALHNSTVKRSSDGGKTWVIRATP